MVKNVTLSLLVSCFLLLTGCTSEANQSIVNRYAEALLTKNNELQFRFKINEKIFTDETMYKIKVSIHNEELANALGAKEIYYGQESVYEGLTLEVDESKEQVIYMQPIPLRKDMHTFEIEELIVNQHAVSVEVYTEQEVIATAFLTNFSSQL
ncbi:hypothetical protein [Bacillus dakarensis]|uniref:hypothetical protein n=1 Tax=Robertmurraya dakarensis TaxID=1926278 RepID=UPI00098116E5|nr:hypothetical protein [Bacillus dakarensis]